MRLCAHEEIAGQGESPPSRTRRLIPSLERHLPHTAVPDNVEDHPRELSGAQKRFMLWFILGATVLRVVAGAVSPLLDDEAYYWVWSRHLDWSYLDHPPVIAYLIFLTTRFGDSALWVRLGPILLGVATTYGMFLLGRELFDARVGMIAAGLFQVVPILAGGTVVASPDAPLFLAWTMALRFVWQAVHGRRNRWTAAGLALGFGLLSKLHIIFLVAGIVLFLAVYRSEWFGRPQPYRAAALAVLLFLPVIYWNVVHEWAMVRFILSERPAVLRGAAGVADLLVRQLSFTLLLSPVLCYALYVAWKRRADERFAYLFWTSLPVIALPLALGLTSGAARGTWLAPGYLGLAVVIGTFWNRVTSALAAVTAAILGYVLLVPLMPRLPIPASEELYGWQEATERVVQEARLAGRPTVLMADRYEVAALLTYYTREAIPVVFFPCPNPASIWPRVEKFRGASAVTVLDARWTPAVAWTRYFSNVEEAASLILQFHARPRTFRIFRLEQFTPDSACSRRQGNL